MLARASWRTSAGAGEPFLSEEPLLGREPESEAEMGPHAPMVRPQPREAPIRERLIRECEDLGVLGCESFREAVG